MTERCLHWLGHVGSSGIGGELCSDLAFAASWSGLLQAPQVVPSPCPLPSGLASPVYWTAGWCPAQMLQCSLGALLPPLILTPCALPGTSCRTKQSILLQPKAPCATSEHPLLQLCFSPQTCRGSTEMTPVFSRPFNHCRALFTAAFPDWSPCEEVGASWDQSTSCFYSVPVISGTFPEPSTPWSGASSRMRQTTGFSWNIPSLAWVE